ncbi:hypothetical protein [Plantibacter sp. YIM 135347]|jgi:hypothetical protein|uniref:hypothetical protein n=1 Tax=Plantibacter sp. YIM 135347 TaxID=3423919 RepID=UPI003D3338DE
MRITAVIRPDVTLEATGKGEGVDELRADILSQVPEGHELTQILVAGGRVDGNLVGTGVYRPTETRTVEGEGPDYASASAAAIAAIPEGWVQLWRTIAS